MNHECLVVSAKRARTAEELANLFSSKLPHSLSSETSDVYTKKRSRPAKNNDKNDNSDHQHVTKCCSACNVEKKSEAFSKTQRRRDGGRCTHCSQHNVGRPAKKLKTPNETGSGQDESTMILLEILERMLQERDERLQRKMERKMEQQRTQGKG